MANQFANSGSPGFPLVNHDSLVGRNPGEDVDIEENATLVIDSMPQHTAMGVLGQLDANEGRVLIDGRSVREIAYQVGAGGALPIVGDIITNLTQTGTAKVIEVFTGSTVATGRFTVVVQTGTFNDTDVISLGAWLASVNGDMVVGYLRIYTDASWVSTGLCSWEFRGEWYEVGVGDGTNNQTFTLPHSGVQVGIWVETGAGTNIFEPWVRIDDAEPFANFADTQALGHVFQHTPLTNVLRFGTVTNGGAPALGARIRIPNIHLGETDTTDQFTENFVASGSPANYPRLPINGVDDHLYDTVNFSTFQLAPTGWRSGRIQNVCAFGSIFQIQENGLEYTNCILVNGGDVSSVGSPIQIGDASNLTFTDCVFGMVPSGGGQAIVVASTSSNLSFFRCKATFLNQGGNNNSIRTYLINVCADVVIEDCVGIGGNIDIVNTPRTAITNFQFAMSHNFAGSARLQRCVEFRSNGSEIVLDGVTLLGEAPTQEFVRIADTSDITVLNIGDVLNKVDCQNRGGSNPISIAGGIARIFIAGCYFENHNSQQAVATTNAGAGPVTVLNCSGDYDSRFIPDANDQETYGLHCSSGAFNSVTGTEVDYTNVFGTHFYNIFTSDTEGKVGVLFNPSSPVSQPLVQITSGSPVFRGDGDLLMRDVGDQIEYTFSREILGATGFQNLAPLTSGAQLQNIDIEYAIDTGTGFGPYQAAIAANLFAEAVSAAGFGLRIRLTANASNVGTVINGLAILTDTTLAAQAANLYSTVNEPNLNIEEMVREIYNDRGNNVAFPKRIIENVVGESYDEVVAGVTKEVRKVGSVTTITRLP